MVEQFLLFLLITACCCQEDTASKETSAAKNASHLLPSATFGPHGARNGSSGRRVPCYEIYIEPTDSDDTAAFPREDQPGGGGGGDKTALYRDMIRRDTIIVLSGLFCITVLLVTFFHYMTRVFAIRVSLLRPSCPGLCRRGSRQLFANLNVVHKTNNFYELSEIKCCDI